MRRRALLASSAASGGGGQGWAYELHLTTSEWVQEDITSEFAIFEGDFKELRDLTINMVKTLGYKGVYDYELYDIPEEFDFTIEGLKANSIHYSDNGYLFITFGDSGEIDANIYDSMIHCFRFKI